ncbi:MAG: META domain-containing protein [Chloroflexota bacterium]
MHRPRSPHRRASVGIALLLVVASIASGCQVVPGPGTGPGQAAIDGTAWRAVAVAGRAVLAEATPTIRFDGDRISGTTGCNTFGGMFELSGDRISFSELVMTEIGCGGAVGEQESRFLEALLVVDRIEVGGGSLRLVGTQGSLDFVSG